MRDIECTSEGAGAEVCDIKGAKMLLLTKGAVEGEHGTRGNAMTR